MNPSRHWLLPVLFIACIATPERGVANYEIGFSTFLGGSDWEHARDICVDDEGNIVIVGGTASFDFPVTENAFQTDTDQSGTKVGSGGYCDAFVSKFGPDGRLLWSSLLGGPNYDRAYGVRVDGQGAIFVCGRAGPGFPVTGDAFQPQFKGSYAGIYGDQNGFIAKITSDGSAIEWASYVGVNLLCRDLSIDEEGSVYLPLAYTGKGVLPPKDWFSNAYQSQPAGSTDVGAVKVASGGRSVLWATWFGGSKNEVPNCGIRIDGAKNVYLNFNTQSDDVPTTEGAHDRSHNGGMDAFVAKLSADGSQLMYGTYFGGAGDEEGNSTHNLAVTDDGTAFLVSSTSSSGLGTTEGAIQSTLTVEGERDVFAARFSSKGQLTHCTYLGGPKGEAVDGVCVDASGNVVFTGSVSSTGFPVTDHALHHPQRSKPNDAIVTVLSPDLSKIIFSSRLGGESYDDGRCCCTDGIGNVYIAGSTNGPGWPVREPHQPNFAGGGGGKELCYKGGCFAGDVILTKLTPSHATH